MTSHRTSPHCLAAAIVGFVAVTGSSVVAQDIPEVRPSVEIFGHPQFRAATPIEDAPAQAPPAKFPFSVLEPDWQSAEPAAPPRELRSERPIRVLPTLIPTPTVEPAGQFQPVQSTELPELKLPAVDAASAKLVSPAQEAKSLPVLTAPEEAELVDPPAYAPQPAAKDATASAEDLEGMLHGMLWITGTIGLGAVVSLWMLKLYLTRGGRTMLPSKSLKLVDTLRIGPRCGVYLVQAETHRVLVGIEHGKTMCLMPLPENFSESLNAAEGDVVTDEPLPSGTFETVADIFTARRNRDERSKGATS